MSAPATTMAAKCHFGNGIVIPAMGQNPGNVLLMSVNGKLNTVPYDHDTTIEHLFKNLSKFPFDNGQDFFLTIVQNRDPQKECDTIIKRDAQLVKIDVTVSFTCSRLRNNDKVCKLLMYLKKYH